jgi:hypothetical protein
MWTNKSGNTRVTKISALIATSALLTTLALVSAFAADTDPFLGTWKLDAAQSKAEAGAIPKSETRTYTVIQGGVLTLVVDGVGADGIEFAYGATGDITGKEYPVTDRGQGARILGDEISWKKIDDRTIEMDIKTKGEVINATRHSVSTDGKTLTITENGIDPDGKPIQATTVYHRG